MMYRENLVVAIKVNGRVLREMDGEVALPFGCEYSILIKNLNNVRVLVEVAVDGVDAGDGRIIINPNSDFEMERFIRHGNLESGNRFRFIERTEDIEKHRGIKVDDGIVRVEGWREHEPPAYVPPPRYYPPIRPRYSPVSGRPGVKFGAGRPLMARGGGHPQSRGAMQRPSVSAAGITVPGSESRQQFHSVNGFPLEPQSVVLVLRLKGDVGEVPVMEAVTVDRQNICSTCGKNNKHRNKFCFSCGTALQLI